MPKIKIAKLRVLVIDDHRYARQLLRYALEAFGVAEIHECPDALHGLSVLNESPIDLVLVDYGMPGLNGADFTWRVRNGVVRNDEVAIIMVSSHTDRQTVLAARNAGVHEFVGKPFAVQDLYLRIHTTFANPRPFIRTTDYIGPDRRWLDGGPPTGTGERRRGAAG